MEREEQRALAGRALFAKVLADEVAKEVKRSRGLVEPTLVAGEKVKAVLPDGRAVGTLQLTEQPESVTVTDAEALLAYVRRTRPDEIETTERIRPAFLDWLKGEARRQLAEDEHEGLVVDKDGEVVPGLALDYGSPRYLPTVTPAGRKAIREVLGRLLGGDLGQLLALTQGRQS